MGNGQSAAEKSPAEFISETIASGPVAVFSFTTCRHCVDVKALFAQLRVPATVVELDTRPDKDKLRSELARTTGARTVPQVFVCGQHIGGGSDTRALHNAGRLVPLLAKCWKPARREAPSD